MSFRLNDSQDYDAMQSFLYCACGVHTSQCDVFLHMFVYVAYTGTTCGFVAIPPTFPCDVIGADR
jgi:hypothetical protein